MPKNESYYSNVQRYPSEINFVDTSKPLTYAEQAMKSGQKCKSVNKPTLAIPCTFHEEEMPKQLPFGLMKIQKFEKARKYEMEGLNGFQIMNKLQQDKYLLSRVVSKQAKINEGHATNPLIV